jgi:hypothetical protein
MAKNERRVRGATFSGDVTVGGEVHANGATGKVRKGNRDEIRSRVQDNLRKGKEKAKRGHGVYHEGDLDMSVTAVIRGRKRGRR